MVRNAGYDPGMGRKPLGWSAIVMGILGVAFFLILIAVTVLARGAVREWADGRTLVEVEFTANDYDPFFNVNRPQDLGRAEVILTQLD